jgi:hypothetical protein
MRRLAVFVVGLLLGAAAAAGLVYVSPLANPDAPAVGEEQWLSYDAPVQTNLALTHGGDLPLSLNPLGVPELWESTIDGTALLLVALRDADGGLFGLGTRITTLSERTDLLLTGVAVDSVWTISAPGRGSLFVIEQENAWPVVRDILLPAALFAREWRGIKGYAVTTGPQPSGYGLVLGVTGEFRDQRGRAQERYELRRYSASEGPLEMSAELGIVLPSPPVASP